MREVDSTPANQSQRPFEQSAYSPDQHQFDQIQQAAYSPALNGPIVEIPTLFTNNPNIETRGFYFGQSLQAQLFNKESPSMGHMISKDRAGNIQDWATNTFVSSSGLAVTDWHAVKNAASLEVTANGRVHQAKVIDVDPKTDQALIQVLPATAGETFSPVHFGSSQLAPGEHATFLGFPKRSNNLHMSSANWLTDLRAGEIPMKGGPPQGEDPNRIEKEFETNIQGGNSGGAAFRDDGDVIGIASTTNEGKLATITPSEDVVAFIRRTQHDFPTGTNLIGSTQNYYDKALSLLPDRLAEPLADFSQSAGNIGAQWLNYIRNLSLKQLLS
jgi:S1-C subfamily serine protease